MSLLANPIISEQSPDHPIAFVPLPKQFLRVTSPFNNPTDMFRAHFFLSMTVIAVLTALVVATAAADSKLSEGKIRSGAGIRELHELPWAHSHGFRPAFTQTPTQFDDQYYTDDGAIDESMMDSKKELFHEEHHDGNDKSNQFTAIAALDSQQGESSSSGSTVPLASLLFAFGINAFLAL